MYVYIYIYTCICIYVCIYIYICNDIHGMCVQIMYYSGASATTVWQTRHSEGDLATHPRNRGPRNRGPTGAASVKHATSASAPAELGGQIHKVSRDRARTQVPPQAQKLHVFLRKWHVRCLLELTNNNIITLLLILVLVILVAFIVKRDLAPLRRARCRQSHRARPGRSSRFLL